MNRRHMVQILAVMALSPTAIATKGAAQSDKREVISSAAGVQATVAPDGVVRIAWSRTDVPVTVDGAPSRRPPVWVPGPLSKRTATTMSC